MPRTAAQPKTPSTKPKQTPCSNPRHGGGAASSSVPQGSASSACAGASAQPKTTRAQSTRTRVQHSRPQRSSAPQPCTTPRRRQPEPKLKVLSCNLNQIYKKKIQIRSKDVTDALTTTAGVIDSIVETCQSDVYLRGLKRLNAGSYYEHLKVSSPKEFDIMLVVPIPVTIIEASKEFVKLQVKNYDNCPDKWQHVCVKQTSFLSPYLLKECLRKVVVTWVKNNASSNVRVQRSEKGCPAVTLQIDGSYDVDLVVAVEIPTWPGHVKWHGDGLFVTTEMEKRVKSWGCHAVAKSSPDELYVEHRDLVLWRLSFSHAEKEILHTADTRFLTEKERLGRKDEQCRKQCLKLFKQLIISIKESTRSNRRKFASFTTYHAKTVALHVFSDTKTSSIENWKPLKLSERLIDMWTYLLECLENQLLCHYFQNDVNLLGPAHFQRVTLDAIINELEPVLDDLRRGFVPKLLRDMSTNTNPEE